MPILNYLSLAVRDYQESRNWYAINLGLKVEFEVPGDRLAALQDDTGLTIFLQEEEQVAPIPSTVLYFQVESAEAMYRQLAARGVDVVHPPQMQPWG